MKIPWHQRCLCMFYWKYQFTLPLLSASSRFRFELCLSCRSWSQALLRTIININTLIGSGRKMQLSNRWTMLLLQKSYHLATEIAVRVWSQVWTPCYRFYISFIVQTFASMCSYTNSHLRRRCTDFSYYSCSFHGTPACSHANAGSKKDMKRHVTCVLIRKSSLLWCMYSLRKEERKEKLSYKQRLKFHENVRVGGHKERAGISSLLGWE